MFICENCDKLVENPTSDYICPRCGDVLSEANECKICGSYDRDENHFFGYCRKCLEKKATFKNAVEYGKREISKVPLNGLITHMFTNKEIEKILLEYCEKHQDREENAKTYCLCDEACFTDFIDEICR